MCDKAVSNDLFMIKYCLGRYKTQEICDKAVNDFLPALKLVPDWFVTSKMVKKLHNPLFTDDDILFFKRDSANVTFSSDETDVFSVDLNNINFDDVNFDEDDPETIIHFRILAWYNRFKQRKDIKEIEPIFTDKNKNKVGKR